jgi:NitT/TauT family transport system substrate-binding protein/putative hydroxymethylpyrimidine transport system substrate-binding protein
VRRALILLLAGWLLAACGADRGSGHPTQASLVLDFTPNAVHAGIYSALAHHYDTEDGVRLHVVVPSASTDSVKLLSSGRADFAILDIHDLAIARERGVPLVGIMAIVERPLAAVIAAPGVKNPRQLEGRLTGITGVPSDMAVLNSIVSGAGGTPARLKTVTIGFNAVPDLLSGRVDAATAFWNDEGVALERARPGFHVFRVDSYGAPPYPELVLTTTRALLRHHPDLAQAVVRALERGYQFTLEHPAASAAELESQVPGLNPALVKADLSVLLPAFALPHHQAPGVLDYRILQRWARWETRFGIVKRPPDVGQTFNFTLAGSGLP